MGFLEWTAAVGGLLLVMSLASGWISRAPVTTFGVYLAAGIICDQALRIISLLDSEIALIDSEMSGMV